MWKRSKSHPDYFVSDRGEVAKLSNGKLVNVSYFYTNSNYKQANLWENGEKKHAYIHRMVAEMFCYKPYCSNYVHHINEVKSDNRACNLMWVTASENFEANNLSKRVGVKRGKTMSIPITAYKNGKPIFVCRGSRTLSKTGYKNMKFYNSNVCDCLKGRRKTSKGFSFKYATKSEKNMLGEKELIEV